MIKKIILSLVVMTLVTPFVYSIFFIRDTDFVLGFIIDFGAFILIIILNFIYYIIERKRPERFDVIYTSIGTIIFFIITYDYQLGAANYLDFKKKELSMNNLVREIHEFSKIKSMTNMDRAYKEINGVEVTFYKEYLIYNKIDSNGFELLRKHLIELGIFRFDQKFGKIFFINGGFIDSESGYVYSADGTAPIKYEGGAVFDCQRVADNWFYFYED